MIDLHCHVLPGIDDGPADLEGSLALARRAREAGIRTLVATPHVNSRCPNGSDRITTVAAQLRAELQARGSGVELLAGAEISLSRFEELADEELARLGLGGGPWLLVEPPFAQVALGLESVVMGILRRGHRVVLAHPERCPALQREPRVVSSLADAGVLMSVTAGSLAGRFGREPRRFAMRLVGEGLVHNVTSDAHDHLKRPPGLRAEIDQAGLAPLREWLTDEVPTAVLAGEAIPARPSTPVRARRMRLRLGRV